MLELWEFCKNVAAEIASTLTIAVSLAAWQIRKSDSRAKCRAALVRSLAPARAVIRAMSPVVRRPWMWPMLAIPVGIGLETTRWAATVEVAGGALATLYLCAAAIYIVQGRLR